MRWRKAAAAGGAALGAAALYSATAERRAAPLMNQLGGESHELTWRGHRIAYTRHGSGSPVLLVHGVHTGASSYEWRHAVDSLAQRYSVYAVDLLGFGLSARPALRYTPALYQALLADVMTQLGVGPLAVVASALSAANVVALAARDPKHFAALALIAPTGVVQARDKPTTSESATQLLLETPMVGTAMYNVLTSNATMRQFLEESYANDRLVTDDLVDAYVQSARQPGGRHVVAALAGGRLNVDIRNALRRVQQPTLLLWGDQARQNSVQHAHAFRVLKPDADWVLVSGAGDFPHAERAEQTNHALHRFLERVKSGTRVGGGPRRMSGEVRRA